MEALERAHVTGTGHLRRLDDAGTGPPGGLGAERRTLVAVQLQHRQPQLVAIALDLLERGVDEHPAQLGSPAQRSDDPPRLGERAASRARGREDHADRPRAELHRELGVVQVGDAADLHPRLAGADVPGADSLSGGRGPRA